MRIKILHVWDQAGTASVIAKWQRKIGHDSVVIKNAKHDKLHQTSYYGGIIIQNKIKFVLKCITLSKKYDIIHLHDAWFLPVILKTLYPRKKIVMHYHGSMIRDSMKETRRKVWERFVDIILVSTPDLLDFKYRLQPYYIPNPVDTDLFKSRSIPLNGRALISLKKDQPRDPIKSSLGIEVILDTISKEEQVDYERFPDRLSQYEYYIDFPQVKNKLIHANSVCGLQAMSMGLKVISWDHSVKNTLPEIHRPENVVRELEKIYATL